MKILNLMVLSYIFALTSTVSAQEITPSIIPQPLVLKQSPKVFKLSTNHTLNVDPEFKQASNELQQLKTLISSKIKSQLVEHPSSSQVGISILKDPNIQKEGYTLTINATGIQLKASHRIGLFYAIQTLAQLFAEPIENIPSTALPHVEITDHPRFGFRGLMLDPARHSLPIPQVKQFIDVMASYKFNRLHLHLTDDHGWRIEIKKYPC